MMSTSYPRVKDTYFQHPVLTKIQGRPTYESLQTLSKQIKANATSVPSTIGGGLYGHLGLVLSASKYANLAGTVPWITPGHPGPFAPPAGATGPQIEAAKDVWRALNVSFDLYEATSKALISQVVDAIDEVYLAPITLPETGQLLNNIRDVLEHLFETHGKITPHQVKMREIAIYHMNYTIALPVDHVFTAVSELRELAEQANTPMSEPLLTALAYVVLSKEPMFQQDFRTWLMRPEAEQTWSNMLIHFRSAQNYLSCVPTAGSHYTQGQENHHANAAIVADLVTQRLLETLPPSPPDELPVPPEFANAALQQQRETTLATREAALLASMQQMMALMRTGPTNNRNNNRPPRDRGGRGQNARPNGGRGRGLAPLPRQYCWSHGYCAHGSELCNNQLPGHQVTATATNDHMQGGSTNNCF